MCSLGVLFSSASFLFNIFLCGNQWRISSSSYQYRNSHYIDKAISQASHLYNGNHHTGYMELAHWFSSLCLVTCNLCTMKWITALAWPIKTDPYHVCDVYIYIYINFCATLLALISECMKLHKSCDQTILREKSCIEWNGVYGLFVRAKSQNPYTECIGVGIELNWLTLSY